MTRNLIGKTATMVGAGAFALVMSGAVQAAGNATQPTICDRACWSSRSTSTPTEMSALNRAIIHHTAGVSDYNTTSLNASKAIVRATQNFHMDVNGWSDVGYHFLFDKLGNSFEGRRNSIDKNKRPRGAHDGVNSNSFGFSNLGYYHPPYNHTITTAQKDMLYDVIAWRMPDGWSPYGASTYNGKTVGYLDGHRDAKATACPGDGIYNTIIGTNHNSGEARDEVDARINASSAPTYIVNNDDGSPDYTTTGSWSTSGSSGYNGSSYQFAFVGGSHTATWTADLAVAGEYEVEVIYRAGSNRATSASYSLSTMTGSQTATANQTLNNLSWVSLGNFDFNAGDQTVTLSASASTGNAVVIADAVRFTLVNEINVPPANALDLDNYTIGSYGSQDVNSSSFEKLDDGYTLRLYGNTWKTINLGYAVTSTTVIEFDYKSDGSEPEIGGIVFDTDTSLSETQTWKVFGTQTYGNTTYDNYSPDGWTRYTIPVGQTLSAGTYAYLILANDMDSGSGSNSFFRNIEVYDTQKVIDNDGGAPDYTTTGSWSTSGSSGYNGGTYQFAFTGGSHSATWDLDIPTDGDYQVEVMYRAGTNRASSTNYDITRAGGTSSVNVNQQNNNLVWVNLGTFTFEANNGSVKLDVAGSSGGAVCISDAVRVTKQ